MATTDTAPVCDPPLVTIERGGVLLAADPNDPREAEGILNPAVAGDYLLYRAVAKGNYSRIMVARLQEAASGQVTAQKLHRVVLEPEKPYEIVDRRRGGIEDPRVTPLPGGGYVMFYTGYGRDLFFNRRTPVVALALSQDGLNWERQGRISFAVFDYNGYEVDFNVIGNKDTVLFSEKINGRYTIFHRPMFTREQANTLGVPWRGIWHADAQQLRGPWEHNRLVLSPLYEWEGGGIGSGVPPIHLTDGWIHLYHGFTKPRRGRQYNAGVFTTPHDDPTQVAYRSNCTILQPTQALEMRGTVPNVVFPTAAWALPSLPYTLAIFWGAADSTIMWGSMKVVLQGARPTILPLHTP